jgi:hypothetical protein
LLLSPFSPPYQSRCRAKIKPREAREPSCQAPLPKQSEDRGDILVRGLWARRTDCIIDVRITDVDAKSQRSKDPLKVLEAHEREKKKKYLEACLEQRRHFSPFVASTDGLLGKESQTLLKKLSALCPRSSLRTSGRSRTQRVVSMLG